MPVLINQLPINLASGSQAFGPLAITQNIVTAVVRLARATTLTPTLWADPTTTISLELDASLDGGASFQQICALTSAGGIFSLAGVEAPETFLTCSVPRAPDRQIRGRITVTNGPLATLLTVDTSAN